MYLNYNLLLFNRQALISFDIYAAPTVMIVFFSMTKKPRTLNPMGSPLRRSRNTPTCDSVVISQKINENADTKNITI